MSLQTNNPSADYDVSNADDEGLPRAFSSRWHGSTAKSKISHVDTGEEKKFFIKLFI